MEIIGWRFRALFALGIIAGSAALGSVIVVPTQSALAAENTAANELVFWNTIKDSQDATDFRSYLNHFPNGMFADVAKAKIQEFAGTQNSGASKAKPLHKKTKITARLHPVKRVHHGRGKIKTKQTHHISKLARPHHKRPKAKLKHSRDPFSAFQTGGHSSGAHGWGQ